MATHSRVAVERSLSFRLGWVKSKARGTASSGKFVGQPQAFDKADRTLVHLKAAARLNDRRINRPAQGNDAGDSGGIARWFGVAIFKLGKTPQERWLILPVSPSWRLSGGGGHWSGSFCPPEIEDCGRGSKPVLPRRVPITEYPDGLRRVPQSLRLHRRGGQQAN